MRGGGPLSEGLQLGTLVGIIEAVGRTLAAHSLTVQPSLPA